MEPHNTCLHFIHGADGAWSRWPLTLMNDQKGSPWIHRKQERRKWFQGPCVKESSRWGGWSLFSPSDQNPTRNWKGWLVKGQTGPNGSWAGARVLLFIKPAVLAHRPTFFCFRTGLCPHRFFSLKFPPPAQSEPSCPQGFAQILHFFSFLSPRRLLLLNFQITQCVSAIVSLINNKFGM